MYWDEEEVAAVLAAMSGGGLGRALPGGTRSRASADEEDLVPPNDDGGRDARPTGSAGASPSQHGNDPARGTGLRPVEGETPRTTALGTRCARSWSADWVAGVEARESELGRRICGARTPAGTPCPVASNHASGRCAHHGGFDLTGAPKENRNAVVHGLYSRRLMPCGSHCPVWQSCPLGASLTATAPVPSTFSLEKGPAGRYGGVEPKETNTLCHPGESRDLNKSSETSASVDDSARSVVTVSSRGPGFRRDDKLEVADDVGRDARPTGDPPVEDDPVRGTGLRPVEGDHGRAGHATHDVGRDARPTERAVPDPFLFAPSMRAEAESQETHSLCHPRESGDLKKSSVTAAHQDDFARSRAISGSGGPGVRRDDNLGGVDVSSPHPILSLPLPERPVCPYERAEYNALVTDALQRVAGRGRHDGLGVHLVHMLALAQVLVGRAGLALREAEMTERLEVTGANYAMTTTKVSASLTAYERLAREWRRLFVIFEARYPWPHEDIEDAVGRSIQSQHDTDPDPDAEAALHLVYAPGFAKTAHNAHQAWSDEEYMRHKRANEEERRANAQREATRNDPEHAPDDPDDYDEEDAEEEDGEDQDDEEDGEGEEKEEDGEEDENGDDQNGEEEDGQDDGEEDGGEEDGGEEEGREEDVSNARGP